MVTINTNLQSLLVQSNLSKSTNALNKAIERMTTGYKVNHAADNAAGYSIAQNMVSQLSSYDVATDNISMGVDMVSTAQENIALMQSHAERIHNLITQAQNGTYGEQSLAAINSEVQARIDEINRIYANTEYNGINILQGIELPDWAKELESTVSAKAEYNGFIDDPYYYEFVGDVKVRVTDETINSWTHVSEVTAAQDFTPGEKYAVSTAEDLANLAALVNAGKNTTYVKFVMGADIDLSGEEWIAIGQSYSAKQFKGIFDGNGHIITGVTINKEDTSYQGLFGYTGSDSTIKNVGVEDVDIKGGGCTGGLAGWALGTVTNCYSTGSVTGTSQTGGLAGITNRAVTNCYASCSVTGTEYTGGLVGGSSGAVTNCYSTGSVIGTSSTGGLVGSLNGAVTNNCFASGSVTGKDSTSNHVGGLIGQLYKISGTLNLDKIASSGTVSSQGAYGIGNLIGGIVNTRNGTSFSTINITNASALSSPLGMIGFEGKPNGTAYESGQMEGWLSNITELIKPSTTLQVGINGDSSSSITFDTSINYDLSALTTKGAQDKGAFDVINKFTNDLSERATQLGAVSNRLDSALESTSVAMQNLTSSLSTIRDADIATESSNYIKAQILQQAAATLLATANQSPSIALQLL